MVRGFWTVHSSTIICIDRSRTESWVRLFHYLYDRWEAPDAGSSDAGESWNSGSQYRFLVASRIDRLPTSCYTPKYCDSNTFKSNRKSQNCWSYLLHIYASLCSLLFLIINWESHLKTTINATTLCVFQKLTHLDT